MTTPLQLLILVIREVGQVSLPKTFELDGDEGYVVLDNQDETFTVKYVHNRDEARNMGVTTKFHFDQAVLRKEKL